MKIAILSHPTEFVCGVNNVIEHEYKMLNRNNYKVDVFKMFIDHAGRKQYGTICFPANSTLFYVSRVILPFAYAKKRNLSRQLKDYDAIISHSYPMNVIGSYTQKIYHIPHIYIDHGFDPLPIELKWKLWLLASKIGTKYILKHTKKILSVSKYLQNEFKKIYNVESEVLYDGVDVDCFSPINKSVELRRKLGIGDKPFFLYIGHINPQKGVEYIIKAFNLLKDRIPSAALVIGGRIQDNQYFEILRNISNSSVIFTDFIPNNELPRYYASADVFVTGTLWEGFNLPLLEAQVSGTPVVAFNHCSHPEVVDNGKSGILTPPKNIKKLAEGMLCVFENKEEMSKNARKWAEKFSWNVHVEKLEKFLSFI